MRGSIKGAIRSAKRLPSTIAQAETIVTPMMIGMSTRWIACQANCPIPGQPKTLSTTTMPLMKIPITQPGGSEGPLSPLDALLLSGDSSPARRAIMTIVIVLEGNPEPERVYAAFARATQQLPRMTQRVRTAPLTGATSWRADPRFALGNHIRVSPAPGDGSLAAVLGVAALRATEPALPAWCEAFVTQGYAHYCTLLPTSFMDDDAGVAQVAAMLGFLFSMESLALALGCDRAQLELAVRQSHPEAPAKVALLWAAHHQLGLLPMASLRARCDDLLDNPLVVPSFPQYLSGFVQALDPAPALAGFVVEMLSKAFARLPDRVLLPWLPTLITTFKQQAGNQVPVLIREAGRTFPGHLGALDSWTPPWSAAPAARPAPAAVVPGGPAVDLLRAHPATCDAVAGLLGCAGGWQEVGEGAAAPVDASVTALLAEFPVTADALAELIGTG